jgi:hypothetical protein
MEFNVAIDAASMPSLFNQSIETSICEKIDVQIANRMPTAVGVAEQLENSRDFLRRTRDWVIESMDTNDIARQVADNIDISDIVDMLDINNETILENPAFLRQMTEYTRFRSLVTNAVNNIHEQISIQEIIEDKINTMSTNIANEVAEKVMIQIANRLSLSDV